MPKGRPFVPGDPRAGRPKDPAELRALKKLSKAEFEYVVRKILVSDPDSLSGFNKTVMEKWLAQGAIKAIEMGDYTRLMLLMDRIIGKVTEKVELKHEFESLSDEELAQEAEKALSEWKTNLRLK